MWNISDTAEYSALYIPEIRRAGPLSFDWIGRCIYWSDKVNAKIYRTSLITHSRDTVTVVRHLVTDLVVDSVNAFLYWTTDYTVESCRLNGLDHVIIQNITLSSSTQVLALTLDLRDGQLFWLAKNGLLINLYNAKIRRDGSYDLKVTELVQWSTSETFQHALMFHSDRLFWLNNQKYITVQELSQRSCTPFSQPAQFMAFSLALNDLKPLPGNFSYTPEVTPDVIPISSFEIRGNYSHFLILWKEPSNIEYGTLFYCVELTTLHKMGEANSEFCLTQEIFTDPYYTVEGLEPYTKFHFAVTPYTYWAKGPTTSLTLRAPEGVPSSPLNLRTFLMRNSSVFNTGNIGVEIRWDNPKMINGALICFTVSYRVVNKSELNENPGRWTSVNTTTKSINISGLSPELLLQFQVKAYTTVGPGPFSDISEAFISDVIPSPALISISPKGITLFDIDLKDDLWNFTDENIRMASFIAHEENVYFLLQNRMFLRDIKSQSTVLVLEDERLSDAQSMTVQWITRHIYIAVCTEQNGTQLLYIDLEQRIKMLKPISTSQISPTLTINTIMVFPLLSRLYWTESWDIGGTISYYDIIKDTVVNVFGQYDKTFVTTTSSCDCYMFVRNLDLSPLMTLDVNNFCFYYLVNVTDIWASDMDGCHCWKVLSVPLLTGDKITSLAVDDHLMYWSIQNGENTSIFQANKRDKVPVLLQIIHEHVQISAYSTSLQPFPDKKCLILASNITEPVLLSTTNTSVTIQLPYFTSELTCPFILSCTPTYKVTYKKLTSADNTLPTHPTTLEFQEQIAVIPKLQPFSNYDIEVTVRNYYSVLFGVYPLGTFITAKTSYGVPEAAVIVVVNILSDTSVSILWKEPSIPNGPLEAIRYQIKANDLPPSPVSPWRKSEFPDEQLSWSLNNLQGGTDYEIMVLAFHPDEDWYTESSVVYSRTLKAPAMPHNIVPGNTSLELQWKAPENPIMQFWFELKQLTESNWYLPLSSSCTNTSVYYCMLTGVVPNAEYHIRVAVVFISGAQSLSGSVNFRTSAGVPSKPGVPENVPGDENTIQWKTPEDNGGSLIYNILQFRHVIGDARQQGSWQIAYNGSCVSICIWKSKVLDGTYQLRAAAANIIGLGEYSDISKNILLYKENNSFNIVGIIVGSILGIVLVLLLMIVFVMYKIVKRKNKQSNENVNIIHEDKELAMLRGLSNTVGLANGCYAVGVLPTKNDNENLPSFPRENLTLCLLLGSGAFGEVYEGIAKDILGPGTGTRNVAVKTLKSDATDNEKVEFLKEAQLMSQFHHSHILRLLGVCLFNEPQYIILELMDGGDLLSYLRGARPKILSHKALLSSPDLLDMALDISRGCAYLEKMHFVHRDLAARNCLVSVKEYNDPSRTIKIGDFGLARDVYKSDYYRKKDEGFLPVRWMAPESLIDGLFTNRSDVWSFGVLLWELFTLGQQPYQGYSNIEVLHYVRSGQTMDSPENCPDVVWDLILKCWMKDPLKRPRFDHIQAHLEKLKGCSLRCSRVQKKTVDLEGIDNAGFEDNDASATALPETGSLTLTEARTIDGLNYLMVTM